MPTSTRSSGSRNRPRSGPVTGWPAGVSSSAAPPARWSAVPWGGWPATTPRTSPQWPSPQTLGSATWTPSTNPTGWRGSSATRHSAGALQTPRPSRRPGPADRWCPVCPRPSGLRHRSAPSSPPPGALVGDTEAAPEAPLGAAVPGTDEYLPPPTATQSALVEVLAELVPAERVTVDSHFFDDLGADSMVMTQFCARVRKRQGLPSISIKDVYQHSTVRSLATALAPATGSPSSPTIASAFAEV